MNVGVRTIHWIVHLATSYNWRILERYKTILNAFNSKNILIEFAKELLSREFGFKCQYDRKKNLDIVWSVFLKIKFIGLRG